jgi:hypothetical protein
MSITNKPRGMTTAASKVDDAAFQPAQQSQSPFSPAVEALAEAYEAQLEQLKEANDSPQRVSEVDYIDFDGDHAMVDRVPVQSGGEPDTDPKWGKHIGNNRYKPPKAKKKARAKIAAKSRRINRK